MTGETARRTDMWNAERLVEWYGADLRYVGAWKTWHAWDGRRWVLDTGCRCERRAALTAQRIFSDASDEYLQAQASGDEGRLKTAKANLAWAMKSQNARALADIIKVARSAVSIGVDFDRFDADPWLLNVANGTIDLRTGELLPHDRADLITKLAPIDYDPDATAPRFERFISEIMAGDEELVDFVHRHLGYCLTGDVREHVLAFWHGPGGNGKGVLGALLLHILGDYAIKAAPDLLFRSEYTDRHPTELADLFGRRLIICNETTRGRAWDEGTVKDTTGGDRIRARRMRENFWEFDPTHKLIVWGNTKPRITVVDDAMRRRLRLVPFAVSFVGREDRGLLSALVAEASGVLAWLVRGCIAWQRDGLPAPRAVREATDAYMRDEDTLGQFFERECRFEQNAKVTRKALRDRYVRWSEERDEKPVGGKVFAEAVRRRGAVERSVRTESGPREGWHGVRLATDAERAASEAWTACSGVVGSSGQNPVDPLPRAREALNGDLGTTGHYSTTDNGPGIFDDLIGGGE